VYYVYILRSIAHPKQIYIGYTHDLKTRLAQHNAGRSAHTSKFAPWSVATYIALPDKSLAFRLEKYLKSGSGHSFAKRLLLGPETSGKSEA
jgi:putative endonuclease